jgi:hyperosmotically inducible periplasmic protein
MITKSHLAMLVAATFLAGAPAYAQGTAPAADNTKSNKTDPSNRSVTADDQKNDTSDLKLTQQIRKSVVADKSLSTYAHNVKIVAVGGNVTLSGVVRSQAEKDAVGAKAQAVVQHGSLTNDIKITP